MFNAETLIVGFAAGIIGIGITLLLTIPVNVIIHAYTGISGMAALPWLGAMWWGVGAAQLLRARAPGWLAQPVGRAGGALAWLGRWSLSYYMLHQPVLIGALTAWAAWGR